MSNNSSGEINIYNNNNVNNIIPLTQMINHNKDEIIKFIVEEELLYKHLSIAEVWLDLQNVS